MRDRTAASGVSVLALAAVLAATPLSLVPGDDGGLGFEAAKAVAKDGRDDDGGDSSGRGGDDDSGSDRSGRGGDDDSGSDRSGRGGDDDSGSDRSGRGDDDDSDSDDDGGRDDSSGRGGGDDHDDDDDDDRSGSGRGGDDDDDDRADDDDDDDDHRGRDGGAAIGAAPRGGDGQVRVVKVEERASGIEVVYSNGIKEEIEDGRYEQKNAAGRTVVERPARAADFARLRGNVRNSSLTPPTATRGAGGATSAPRLPSDAPARVVKIEERASGIEVVYSNGIKEEIENGRYEQKNAAGRTVVERPAEAADFARLRGNVRNSGLTLPTPARGAGSSASGFAPRLPPDAQARRIEISGGNIEVRYTQGWREEIEFGRYELKDPNNNTVIERPATQTDRDRLLALTGR